jgi:hypothetical protein
LCSDSETQEVNVEINAKNKIILDFIMISI